MQCNDGCRACVLCCCSVLACNYWERKLQRFEEVMKQFDVETPGIRMAEGTPVDDHGDVVAVVKVCARPSLPRALCFVCRVCLL